MSNAAVLAIKVDLVDALVRALDSLEDSVVIFDNKWRYVYINDVGWGIIDREKEDVIGENVWELIPQLKGSEFQKSAYAAMRQQKNKQIEEYYPHRREWYRTKFYPSKHFLVMQMQDITDFKQTKSTNDQLFGTLEQAMQVYWSDTNRNLRHQKSPCD